MRLGYNANLISWAFGALLLSGCAGVVMSEVPCEDASREITYGNLLQNSVRGTYDQCLDSLRHEAVQWLER